MDQDKRFWSVNSGTACSFSTRLILAMHSDPEVGTGVSRS